ncbi:hypothetical protein [Nocardioides sp.]|uniref:hypothetical protein n=1 Tax=Nocardioides sp. TaxID=35761 RepID=UPI003526D3D3
MASAETLNHQRWVLAGTALLVAAANASFIFFVGNPDHRDHEGALYMTTVALTVLGAALAIPRASRPIGLSVLVGVVASWVIFYVVLFSLMAVQIPSGGYS